MREDVIFADRFKNTDGSSRTKGLKKPRDFERERGKQVDVSLYEPLDGEKVLVGTLTGYDGATLTLEGRGPIPKEKIAQVRLHIVI